MPHPNFRLAGLLFVAALVCQAAFAQGQSPSNAPPESGASGQQQNDTTMPDMSAPSAAPPANGCPPASYREAPAQSSLLQQIADSSSDCGDMPAMPGWPKPGCPVDPGKPGGAREQACTPPRQT